MAVQYTEAVYNQLYDGRYGRAAFYSQYPDESLRQWRQIVQDLNIKAGINMGNRTLVIGCGYGSLLEVAFDAGVIPSNDRVWGTDDSPYIIANKAKHSVFVGSVITNFDPSGTVAQIAVELGVTEAEVPGLVSGSVANCTTDVLDHLLDINVMDADAQQQLKDAGAAANNGTFTNIVTDGVMSSLETQQEIDDFLARCGLLQQGNGGIYHIIHTKIDGANQDPILNWQYRSFWKDQDPTHWWLDAHGWIEKPVADGGLGGNDGDVDDQLQKIIYPQPTNSWFLTWNPNDEVWE